MNVKVQNAIAWETLIDVALMGIDTKTKEARAIAYARARNAAFRMMETKGFSAQSKRKQMERLERAILKAEVGNTPASLEIQHAQIAAQ